MYEAIRILSDDVGVNKDRQYYHVRGTFDLVEVAGVRKIRRKRDKRIMAVVDKFCDIIRDVRVASGHKGETKTHKKVQEHYSNIPLSAMRAYIATCERCAEKLKKKCARGVEVRPILASSLNERGQVHLVDLEEDGADSVTAGDVHSDTNYSLRELVRLGSVGIGQGYRRCSCRTRCTSNRCRSKKGNVMCNSACQPEFSCENNEK